MRINREDLSQRQCLIYSSSFLNKQQQSKFLLGAVISTKQCLQSVLVQSLHDSVDGRGLDEASPVPEQHQWLTSPTSTIIGANYIEAIKLRGNLMYAPIRAARWRVDANITCDACGRVGSLGHILQVCPRTHASRVALHNSVVKLVATTTTRRGWNVLVEPAIPTTALICRPDLVLHKPSTVVADNADLQEAHLRKCHYDNNSDNQQWVTGKFPDADTCNSD